MSGHIIHRRKHNNFYMLYEDASRFTTTLYRGDFKGEVSDESPPDLIF